MMPIRPRLTPAIADVRRAVRTALRDTLPSACGNLVADPAVVADRAVDVDEAAVADRAVGTDQALMLVGLSGGADSLALAAATAFEAPRIGLRAGAVIVDHGLQAQSADVAACAAGQATALGLDPVLVLRVDVAKVAGGGPEAAARTARYQAYLAAMGETGAGTVLLGHTLDDQAETVLLGLARGSGPTSLHGMAARSGPYLRPLLNIRRAATQRFCLDSGLEPWSDPQNFDPGFARVRVRQSVLPLLEHELGPGITEALARTATQLREDSAALDDLAHAQVEAVAEFHPTQHDGQAQSAAINIPALALQPPAVLQRVIRVVVSSAFQVSLTRVQTMAVVALVSDWHGQKEVSLPGVRVVRTHGRLTFSRVTEPASLTTQISKGTYPADGIQPR